MGRLIFCVEDNMVEVIPKENFILTVKRYFKKFLNENIPFDKIYAKYISERNEIFKCRIVLERAADTSISKDEMKQIKEKTGENMHYDRYGLKIERVNKEE